MCFTGGCVCAMGFGMSMFSENILAFVLTYGVLGGRKCNNIFCRTELFRKSCIPSSVTMWNSLDDNLRNSSSLNSFKYNLKKDKS